MKPAFPWILDKMTSEFGPDTPPPDVFYDFFGSFWGRPFGSITRGRSGD
jgi:hypothetical protein